MVVPLGQLNGGGTQRDRTLVDCGFGSGSLADVNSFQQGRFEYRPDRPGPLGRSVRGPNLTEDMILTKDLRLQSGADSEEVPKARLVLSRNDVFIAHIGLQVGQCGLPGGRRFRDDVFLDPVARL
jgi:hypothetical protein